MQLVKSVSTGELGPLTTYSNSCALGAGRVHGSLGCWSSRPGAGSLTFSSQGCFSAHSFLVTSLPPGVCGCAKGRGV